MGHVVSVIGKLNRFLAPLMCICRNGKSENSQNDKYGLYFPEWMHQYLKEHSKPLQSVLHEVLNDDEFESLRLFGRTLEEVRRATDQLLWKVFTHAALQDLKGLAPLPLYLCDEDVRGPLEAEGCGSPVRYDGNWDSLFKALEDFGHEPPDFATDRLSLTVATCQELGKHAKGLSWPSFESLNEDQISALFSMVNMEALRTLACCIEASTKEYKFSAASSRLEVRADMVLAGREDDLWAVT